MSEEVYKCDECKDRFFNFKMDSFDSWYFDEIIQPEGVYTLCKGYHYHNKVLDMKDLVEKSGKYLIAFYTIK